MQQPDIIGSWVSTYSFLSQARLPEVCCARCVPRKSCCKYCYDAAVRRSACEKRRYSVGQWRRQGLCWLSAKQQLEQVDIKQAWQVQLCMAVFAVSLRRVPHAEAPKKMLELNLPQS